MIQIQSFRGARRNRRQPVDSACRDRLARTKATYSASPRGKPLGLSPVPLLGRSSLLLHLQPIREENGFYNKFWCKTNIYYRTNFSGRCFCKSTSPNPTAKPAESQSRTGADEPASPLVDVPCHKIFIRLR
jgi:hypothetical protein